MQLRKRAWSDSGVFSAQTDARHAKRQRAATPLSPPPASLPPHLVHSIANLPTSVAFDDAGSCLPLTHENLSRFEQSLSSSMSRTSSPNRTNNNLDTRNKLAAYQILVDKERQLPEELARHISEVIRKPRNPDETPSPNARQVRDRRQIAAQQNETNGIKFIEPYLLFRGEAELEDRVAAVPLIFCKGELYLQACFLPQPPSKDIRNTWGALSQPKPDTAIGYVTRSDATSINPPKTAAFTAEEEQVLAAFHLTQYLHFPFLTAQWKTPNSNENLCHAQNQAARDGAVIVNHLDTFYAVAYDRERDRAPTSVETCHFSVACDLHYGQIWVHWKDKDNGKHHMEMLAEFSLRQEAQLAEARCILRNIVSYAVGPRLQSIRNAIPKFATNRASGRGPKIPAPGTRASQSESSGPISQSIVFKAPMTPSSAASEPAKKRPRRGSEGNRDEGRASD